MEAQEETERIYVTASKTFSRSVVTIVQRGEQGNVNKQLYHVVAIIAVSAFGDVCTDDSTS